MYKTGNKFVKSLFKNLLIFAFAITAFSMTVYGAESGKVYFTNDRVNFRSGPSLEDEIMQTLNPGAAVNVLSDTGGEWYKVEYNGNEGYINSEFLFQRTEAATEGNVELLNWQEAKAVFTTFTPARVYDVRSGLSYYIQSFSNGMHADIETLTQEDTNILLSTYGRSWAWDPRPVFVTINGRTLAASINGMPHGGGTISTNGMNGQVCLHFKGSTTHNGNTAFANDHQIAVDEAWLAAN